LYERAEVAENEDEEHYKIKRCEEDNDTDVLIRWGNCRLVLIVRSKHPEKADNREE